MLLQRSKLAVATVDRPRLAPTWSIALLGVMVLAVLVAIYPHKALVQRVLEAPQNEITEAYLINLLRTEPGNPRLGLLLARHQLNNGLLDRAGLTLARIIDSPNPAARLEAIWIEWQLEERRYRLLPDNDPGRDKAREALRARLAQLAKHPWSAEMLAEIARKAIAFGDPKLGLALVDQLATSDHGKSAFWYADAGQTALANSEYRAAAKFYLIALTRASTPQEQRRHFLSAIRAMQSGDLVLDALKMVEEEVAERPALTDDKEILEFLVRLARAGQRPDLADKFARQLLRLSLLEQWRHAQLAMSGFDVRLQRVALESADVAAPAAGPQLPFDDRIYTLGFEAFLDNRNLEDAWKVAASAVRQAPDNLVWRERLAKVSDWSGRPRIALENWLYLARKTGRDDTWQAVLRLAPGLFDDEALRLALQYQLSRHPNDEKLVRELVATHERLGSPRGALNFLEQTYQRQHQPALLEQMAELAERDGDEAAALAYWRRYLVVGELTPARAVRISTLMLLRDQQSEALRVLEMAGDKAADSDAAYWRLTGALARQSEQDEKATRAFRHVVGNADAEPQDYEALAFLLLEQHPIESAEVSAAAWLRFRQPQHLLQALSLFATNERWRETGRLLKSLDTNERRHLGSQAEFLRLSAQYHLNTGKAALARSELEAAIQLTPAASDLQGALLWLLIDTGDGNRLRRVLATGETIWRDDPNMHDTLAAAYLTLSLPDLALRRYLTPHLAEHRNDFLWLMNYADALEQNQETDRAWRLRQYLLARQEGGGKNRRALVIAGDEPDAVALRRTARARLMIAQRPGDAAFGVLRELLRLDRDAEHKLSASARDVALGWLVDREQYSAARGWLWQRYAQNAARPLWAEMSVALATNDVATAGQLLEQHGERLSRASRISAAQLIGDLRLAQSDAFDTQSEQPADDPLHLQLSGLLLAYSHHAGGTFEQRTIGTLGENERAARTHLAISPRLSLDLALGNIARSNHDRNVIGTTPDETYGSARLTWLHVDGETRLTAEDRRSFERYQPLLLEHQQRIDQRLSLNLSIGTDQPTSESLPLRVAGMKDMATMALRYQLTSHDRISIEHQWDRYAAQTGTALGSGRVWQFEAAHALRLDPRDLEASVFWSRHRYNQRTNVTDTRLQPLLPENVAGIGDIGADFFVPNDFNFKGVRLSTDSRFQHDYTRAWRPYASVARTWHSTLGNGYDLSAGFAGSVFGADHLNIGWNLSRGGSDSGGMVRGISATYRHHF